MTNEASKKQLNRIFNTTKSWRFGVEQMKSLYFIMPKSNGFEYCLFNPSTEKTGVVVCICVTVCGIAAPKRNVIQYFEVKNGICW